jgi:hypothetical protein
VLQPEGFINLGVGDSTNMITANSWEKKKKKPFEGLMEALKLILCHLGRGETIVVGWEACRMDQ